MILAFVGSGGKTTLIHQVARHFCSQGKTVLVTTTTHMRVEPDTLLVDDPEVIGQALTRQGYAMAGLPEGEKIRALSPQTYRAVCARADVVLVEADGSRGLPLKYPSPTEPVIPDNADGIVVVCGLDALGRPAGEVCHRLELVPDSLGIRADTVLTPAHLQAVVTRGYLQPLRARYPDKPVRLVVRTDGSLYQRAVAALLERETDVSLLRSEWFEPQPRLVICGAGHVARELAAMAALLDFPVRVVDDRPDLATKARFPTAEQVVCDSYDHLDRYLEPGACYVVVTPSHRGDTRCVTAILPTEFLYLGMIGSKTKVANTLAQLREAGFSSRQLDRLCAPIGLPIGAVTPAEIALSILAQIIQVKNRQHAASADRSLLNSRNAGVLCLIVDKQGSAPRGIGSMMLVEQDRVLGSIGGGESELQAIRHAREQSGLDVVSYSLHPSAGSGLDMVCGGSLRVLFLPVSAAGDTGFDSCLSL